jgi:hypothetical protein
MRSPNHLVTPQAKQIAQTDGFRGDSGMFGDYFTLPAIDARLAALVKGKKKAPPRIK